MDTSHDDPRPTVTRRAALSLLGASVAAVGGVAAMLRYATPARPARLRRVRAEQLPPPGGATIVRGGGGNAVAVANRGDAGVLAFIPRCTHLGCSLTWRTAGQPVAGNVDYFDCPCHNSSFALDGRVLFGPAARDLDRYGARLEADGSLVVDTAVIHRGAPRSGRGAAPTIVP